MIPDLSRGAATALLAAVIGFNVVLLVPELTPVPALNDGAEHYPLVRRAAMAVQRGESPIDHWNSQWVLGFPVFQYYQHLPHLAAAALAAVPGLTTLTAFNLLRVALLAASPLAMFAALRRLGFTRAPATFGAIAVPLISAPGLFGFELNSYVFGGSGLYTQIWGMCLFPLAVAWVTAYAREGKGLAMSAALFAALVVSNTLYGYMAVLAIVALLCLPGGAPLLRRSYRAAAVFAAAGVAVAYFVVPLVLNGDWLNQSIWIPRDHVDGYGHRWVLWRLVNGDLLDAGRWPVLTLLLAIGTARAIARRDAPDRVALTLFVLWVMLFFGRPTWGALFRLLPMNADLHLHRFIGGVHFGAVALVAIGADAIWQAVRVRWRAVGATAAVVVILLPAFRERMQYLRWSAGLVTRNAQAVSEAAADIDGLLNAVRSAMADRPGRVYAGLPGSWGGAFAVGDIPLYSLFSFYGVDTLGYAYHVLSFGGDVQYHFDDRNPLHYDLFNVAIVVAPPAWAAPPFLQPVAQTTRWNVYRAPGSGYFAVTADPPVAVPARADAYPMLRQTLESFRGFTPSTVTASGAQGIDGYAATITTAQPGHAILKMNFHPGWKARVDGREEIAVPIGPLFVGVPIAAGTHEVALVYHAPAYKSWLLVAGMLGLLTIAVKRRQVEAAIDRLPLPRR